MAWSGEDLPLDSWPLAVKKPLLSPTRTLIPCTRPHPPAFIPLNDLPEDPAPNTVTVRACDLRVWGGDLGYLVHNKNLSHSSNALTAKKLIKMMLCICLHPRQTK